MFKEQDKQQATKQEHQELSCTLLVSAITLVSCSDNQKQLQYGS